MTSKTLASEMQEADLAMAQAWLDTGGLTRRLSARALEGFRRDLAVYLGWCRAQALPELDSQTYARFRTEHAAGTVLPPADLERVVQRVKVAVQNMAAEDPALGEVAAAFVDTVDPAPSAAPVADAQAKRRRQNRLFATTFGIGLVGGWWWLNRYLSTQTDLDRTLGDAIVSTFFLVLAAATLASLVVALTSPREILGRPFKRPPRPYGMLGRLEGETDEERHPSP